MVARTVSGAFNRYPFQEAIPACLARKGIEFMSSHTQAVSWLLTVYSMERLPATAQRTDAEHRPQRTASAWVRRLVTQHPITAMRKEGQAVFAWSVLRWTVCTCPTRET